MVWSAENLVPIGVVTWLGSATAGVHQRYGLSHAMAALHTSDGRWVNGSRMDASGGADVSRAAVATARGGMRTPW